MKSKLEIGGLKPLTARLGGKVLLKKKIVEKFFPSSSSYSTYIEPFVGGGSVYFYKEKDGHKEVVNDIDPLITTIFKGFKKYSSDQIAKDVVGNYTKSDFENLLEHKPSTEYDAFLQQFLINRLSFFARSKTFGKPRINATFKGYDERLADATILNEDWKAVVKKYNKKDSFFYLDPPAVAGDSAYRYPAVDVGELKNACDSIVGKFCLTYPDKDDIQKVFSKYNCTKIGTKYVGDRTTGGQTESSVEWVITNYPTGSGSMETFEGRGVKRSDPTKRPFVEYLKEKKIQPEDYLKVVKHVATKKGYDPALLSFNTDGVHKLTYDSPAGIRHFGSAKLNDYIIYVMKEGIDFPVGTASKKQRAYHKRFTDGKVHEKYSPWELSLNLLW
jgi:DNA adenine methylase